MALSIFSISVGAALGALLRWMLATWLNSLLPFLPAGTLAANLIGGYLIGVAVALFAQFPAVSAEVRLFVMTGFLGGLTTFSTFSAEVVSQVQRGEPAWALAAVASHVLGSLLMTVLGIATIAAFR